MDRAVINWHRAVAVAIALASSVVPAYSQALGDVARQEEARRAVAPKAVRTFSNADLQLQDITAPAGESADAPDCYMSVSQGRCISASEMIENSTNRVASDEIKKLEPDWRHQANSLRSQLEKAQRELEVIAVGAADTSRSPGEHAQAIRLLERQKQTVAIIERQWEKFESAAANSKIPRAWLEPVPKLTLRQQE
jgi:hypothetical protein